MECLVAANRLLKQQKLFEAVAEYTSVIRKLQASVTQPEQTSVLSAAYNDRGQCFYLQVEFYKAIDDYNSSLALNPRNPIVLYNRGLVKYRLNNFKEAEKDISQALELSPDFKDARDCLIAINNAIRDKAPTS